MLPAGQIVARLVIIALSPLAGLALARLARRFDGAERISSAWMAAGGLGIAISSISWATSSTSRSSIDPHLSVALSLGLGFSLLALAAVDVAALRLPDLITLPLAAIGLGLDGLAPASLSDRLFGLALGFGAMVAVNAIYVRWRKRQGLGMGDAKLFAAAGAWLGASELPSVLLIACAGGLAWVSLQVSIRGRRAVKAPLPFGLPLACAFWIIWMLERSF